MRLQDDARPKRPPRLMRTEGATDDIMREWTALGNIAEYVPNPSTGPSMTSHLCPETFTLSLRTPGPPAPRPLSASARPRAERPHRSRETAAEGDGPGGMRGSREEACAEGRGEIDAQGSSGREEGEEECVNEDVGAGMGEEEEERGGCGVADALHWGMEWEEELRGLLGTEVDEEEGEMRGGEGRDVRGAVRGLINRHMESRCSDSLAWF